MAKPPQVRKGCPNCGSRRYKITSEAPSSDAEGGKLFGMRDRICKDCGARYTPPMPGFLPYMIIMIGVCLALLGIGAMFGGELMTGPVKFRLWAKLALAVTGLVFLGAGVQLARKKKP